MSKVIDAVYPGQVTSRDLYDRGYGFSGFDATSISGTWDNIITNPPYNLAEKVLQSALSSYRNKVAMLLRLAFLEGQRRNQWLYSVEPPARVYIFSERLTMYPGGDERNGGDGGTIAFMWAIWDKNHSGPTELRWLPLGYKPETKRRRKVDVEKSSTLF